MKKYLLPLIFILLLSFTLTSNCVDWLSGWDYRIEISLPDYAGDIGAAVTWFPVEVFLTAAQCEEIFVELTTDAEYKKMQFTEADGTSLLYGHMKLFDVSETLGLFTVSADGWTINANTSIFLYYDADHADNDTHIGAINTAACEAVYNDEFEAVYTMADGVDNEHIYDATSNNNDGTKKDANQPVEAAGKVGQGQDFDGSDDYIDCGDNVGLRLTNWTIECSIYRQVDSGSWEHLIAKTATGAGSQVDFFTRISDTDKFQAAFTDTLGAEKAVITTETCPTETWVHFVATFDGTNIKIYIDGDLKVTSSNYSGYTPRTSTRTLQFGRLHYNNTWYYGFDGIIDEIRIPDEVRSAAWIKGTYNSLWDSLLTYGSEEEAPVIVNVIFFSPAL